MKKTFVYFHMEGRFRAFVLESENYVSHAVAKETILAAGLTPKDNRILLEYR